MVRHSSHVLIAGALLFVLGLGNWTMGNLKMEDYHDKLDAAVEMGGEEVKEPFRGTVAILEERTDAHEMYEDARARYDYYKLVRRGGRFLMTLGGLICLGALARQALTPLPQRYRERYRASS